MKKEKKNSLISLSDINSIYLLAFSYLYIYLLTCHIDSIYVYTALICIVWICEKIDH